MMDTDGISPIHHENFDWSSFNQANRKVTKTAADPTARKARTGAVRKTRRSPVSSLFKEMKYYTDSKQTKKADYAKWEGFVEQRPSPYDVTDEPPTSSKPATLFVPMFAPDQVAGAYNNWFLYKSGKTSYYWSDVLSTSYTAAQRQAYMPKYFDIASIGYVAPYGTQPAGQDVGPNASCTTQAITPLTDVTATAGMDKIKTAIDAMQPLGGTNVVSGLAWGWRVVSSALPFSEGRPESEKGNDKW